MIDILNSSQTHFSSSIHSINIAKNYHVTFMSDRFVRPAGLYHGYGPIHRSSGYYGGGYGYGLNPINYGYGNGYASGQISVSYESPLYGYGYDAVLRK